MLSWKHEDTTGHHFAHGARTTWTIGKDSWGGFFAVYAMSQETVNNCVATAYDFNNAKLLAEALDAAGRDTTKRLKTLLVEAGFECGVVVGAMVNHVAWLKRQGQDLFTLTLKSKGISILYQAEDSVIIERLGVVYLPMTGHGFERPMRSALAACLEIVALRCTRETAV